MTILCRLADFDEEYPIVRAVVDGFPPLAVYRIGADEVFCTADTCTHAQASLAEGELDGYTVECPFHGGAFDVRDGEPVARPCLTPIRTYPVRLDGDAVVLLDGERGDG
ncbi:non-heme iron oxygenase ferredoxin subunit [Sciscionella sediminilitoris]|uniref:non-heme iron oxygenase ferredoxin subunit n=1 Tax=Sciscionella sediminilitoris TaxID=1445613 RepID=UPI0004DF91C1|nr:non-heme iron oxygenase ferredoxin subunit [Sciscionella sp. SE31]